MKFIFAVIVGSVIVLSIFYGSTDVFSTGHWNFASRSWGLPDYERSAVVFPTNSIEINQQKLPLCDFRDLGKNKSIVLLVVVVSTAPARRDRRDAIRLSWWEHCSSDEVWLLSLIFSGSSTIFSEKEMCLCGQLFLKAFAVGLN